VNQELISDCVHCGFCLPTCPTYGVLWQEEMDSPRGRIYLMGSLLDGTIPLSDTTVQHFDRCLGCMACLTSCPSGVKYDRLIEETRAHVEEHHRRSLFERAQRGMIFATVPYPKRLRRALAMTPPWLPGRLKPFAALKPPWRSSEQPPAVTPAEGMRRARVGLLLGCVQRVVFGDVNAATARVLAAEGCEVIAPVGQECCGALHLHAGRATEGRRRAEQLAQAFEDVDAIVGPRAKRSGLPIRVAYQDACHLGHAQGIRDAPRSLLRTIPGLDLVEPAEQAICCGSAGIYNLVQPAAAAELGQRKAANVVRTGAKAYVSSNPGCLVQVSNYLRESGWRLPALHPVELLDASIQGVSAGRLFAGARR
jgi:glycolate oxidase iron-sulfur subunit